jgi:hypothetical protein
MSLFVRIAICNQARISQLASQAGVNLVTLVSACRLAGQRPGCNHQCHPGMGGVIWRPRRDLYFLLCASGGAEGSW